MFISALPSAAAIAVQTSTTAQKPKEAYMTVSLGRNWPAHVRSLTVAGKAYPAKQLDAWWVGLPKMKEGDHVGIVTLVTGAKIPVTLRVLGRHVEVVRA